MGLTSSYTSSPVGRLIVSAGPDLASLDRWIREFARVIEVHQGFLTELDSAIGDADHGTNMRRGMSAVVTSLDAAAARSESPETALAMFKSVGMTLVSTVGGASGPLYGTFFLRMATASGDVVAMSATEFATVLQAGLAGIVQRGKPEAGDKTMYDSLLPACTALDASLAAGLDLDQALTAASAAADAGRDATTPMQAHKGRASYLGERSIGHQDPGATSAALLVAAAVTAFRQPE